jgi:hypothetical protein
MAAYYQENPREQDGLGGKHNPTPPPCPWRNRVTAVRRDREVEQELATRRAGHEVGSAVSRRERGESESEEN